MLSRKPNPVRLRSLPCGDELRRDDHSSSPAITGGIKQPTRKFVERAVRFRTALSRGASDSPIWPCSVRGFACHRCCHRRGALLPHLFTLTLLRSPIPCGSGELRRASPHEPARRSAKREVGRYIFCATFLRVTPTGRYPAHCPAEFGLSSLRCHPCELHRTTIVCNNPGSTYLSADLSTSDCTGFQVYASFSWLIPYCSSFL